jgi:LuxR family maltose regulon positive regulatory protein
VKRYALGQADWLAETRLSPPRLRDDLIVRPRLLKALDLAIAAHPLTLLAAPAGYGKTTLLSAIANHKSQIANRAAWLSLEDADNDPARFLAGLIAALQCLASACGVAAQALLFSLPNPGAEARRIIATLINELLAAFPEPFALILDDLHLLIEPAVFVALDYLLERAPPPMRLVIGTRHDPPLALARLRARGQLAELRAADLRFTLEETARFFNERLNLGLTGDDLAALHGRTEGWPAGLRLLASSLEGIRSPADRSAFIRDLAHTDRYIFDFLADEVLNRQPAGVRAFLLETAILAELTPARCRAVTGREDAPAILEDLYRRNLFITAAPTCPSPNLPISQFTNPPTYRYHALFAEFLRQRLAQEAPERVRELHRRAAETQADPFRALGHYLAAAMWGEAAAFIEQIGPTAIGQGLLATVAGWINALPAAVRAAHPRLTHLLGVCAWHRGDPLAAIDLLAAGAWAMPVRYRLLPAAPGHHGLDIACLVPRWADVAYFIEQDPRVLFVVHDPPPSPLAGGTTGGCLRWLQIAGAAEPIAAPDWTALLPGWASTAPSEALYSALRVTPTRLDLFDEGRGWGARETVE